ncbi:hypothetical protein SLS53_008882 [Cytospora paraplurivora]|uniref:BZIP domain-containing protein n=1 Tax=Cytospora paraplurivora TaxID=2898453 RepID=A0AAN9YCB3_9PEZI
MAPSSTSPLNIKNEFGGVGTSIAYGAPASSSNQGPSSHDSNHDPLSLNFLKDFADKKFTRDGQPTKRRGPKPDSRPALTRRQELNRQAQRTHRERKELYIKALEDEVLRLKEIFSNVSRDKERLAEENRSLRVILQQNGLSQPGAATVMMDDSMSSPSVGPYIGSNSSASVNGSGSYGLTSTSTQNTSYTPPPPPPPPGSAMSTTTARQGQSPPDGLSPTRQAAGLYRHSPAVRADAPRRNLGVDYDQAGIDFVLSAVPISRNFSRNDGVPPTPANTTARVRSDYAPTTSPGPSSSSSSTAMDVGDPAGPPPRTWELSKADLATLLDLSQKLNLDGEITPVMAWGMVLGHPRLGELGERDFVKLSEELRSKVRCYGFGAVMEEFEVRDALEAIFSTMPEHLGSRTDL